jgi:hypothetical protein
MRLLFRPEAVEAQGQNGLGRVQLVRPLPAGLLGAGAGAVALALAAFLMLAPHTRKVAAAGVLVARGDAVQAQLDVAPPAIASLRPGQAVRLRFEALDSKLRAEGQVVDVALTPAAGPPPVYRVTVAIDGSAGAQLPLAPGMRVDAVVLLERRRLVEWMFR